MIFCSLSKRCTKRLVSSFPVFWSNWSVLDKDWVPNECCDGTSQSRTRDCNDPFGSGGKCEGASVENKTCDPKECGKYMNLFML